MLTFPFQFTFIYTYWYHDPQSIEGEDLKRKKYISNMSIPHQRWYDVMSLNREKTGMIGDIHCTISWRIYALSVQNIYFVFFNYAYWLYRTKGKKSRRLSITEVHTKKQYYAVILQGSWFHYFKTNYNPDTLVPI